MPAARSQADTRLSAWPRNNAAKKRMLPSFWLRSTRSFIRLCGPIVRCLAWARRSRELLLTPNREVWFNVGDSRLYRDRGGAFDQLSIDDVPPGPRSGLITQTLGGAPFFVPIAPHSGGQELTLPSRFLLCSDGLTDMLEELQIETAMANPDEDAVHAMFAAAMQAGGADNISIMVVSVRAND